MSKKHILIYYDDDQNGSVLRDYLQSRGYHATLVQSLDLAFEKAEIFSVSLLILNILQSPLHAASLGQKVRSNKSTKHLPLMLITPHPLPGGGRQNGFNAQITRPFDFNYVLQEVEALVEADENQPKADLLNQIQAFIQKPPVLKPAELTPKKEHVLTTEETPEANEEEEAEEEDLLLRDPAQDDLLPELPEPEPPVFDDEEENKEAEEPEPTPMPAREPIPLKFFNKLWDVLNYPKKVLQDLNPHHDSFVSTLFVVGTPFLAALGRLFQKGGSFDAWISAFSLGLVTNVIMWVGIAGLLHMVVPFMGATLSMKRAFLIAGFGWAPRFVAATLTALYSVLSITGFVINQHEFTAGIDLIPGLPAWGWVEVLSRIGLFDIWSVWIVLTGLWLVAGVKKRKWTPVVILTGFVCLAFGALTLY